MAAVLDAPMPAGRAAVLRAAWRSLRPAELAWFVLVGLAYGLTDSGALLDLDQGAPTLRVVARHLTLPVAVALLLVPFWLPVARGDAPAARRLWQLAAAALLGSALAMALAWPLVRWLDWPSAGELTRAAKGMPMFAAWHWGLYAGDVLSAFVPAALMFWLFDLVGQRRRSAQQLRAMQLEHGRLAREALAARLAALQAQVDPAFLFDTLVDIERAYAGGEPQAPQRLDRLIHHLRVALPRLRDDGNTLAAEAELLASWLAVARDGLGAPLDFATYWPPALAATPLPPMLLLPLLQGALRRAADATLPTGVVLRAQRRADGATRLQLVLDRPGLCPDDALLQALGERAEAWCGAAVVLHCDAAAAATTFTIDLHRAAGARQPPPA